MDILHTDMPHAEVFARFAAAFDLEIKPAILRIMREHFRLTGLHDDPESVEWLGDTPEDCALEFRMESGRRHRIPFALVGPTH